ncbi:hypothetical protein QUF76_12915 [Desulfobacterales bacterium HSG16]|nr:hypothetical protein [Desulfobacterales bacterium HSG16]
MLFGLTVILALALLTVSVCFYRYTVKSSALISRLKRENEEFLPDSMISEIVDDQSVSQKPQLRVAIEVLDPIHIARRESKLACLVTGIIPDFVTKEVYKNVQKEVSISMKERDIDANVTILKLP